MADIDTFFNTGVIDAAKEIQDDIQIALLTKTGSQFYNRISGNSIALRENDHLGIAESLIIKYEIALCLARRNAVVPASLRAVVSQDSIEIERSADYLNISINYIPVENISLHNTLVSLNLSTLS